MVSVAVCSVPPEIKYLALPVINSVSENTMYRDSSQ